MRPMATRWTASMEAPFSVRLMMALSMKTERERRVPPRERGILKRKMRVTEAFSPSRRIMGRRLR